MALGALNLWELHHPAAGVLPRSSPTLSRRTPSTSARIDTSDLSAATLHLPMTLNRFMNVDYRGACFQVSSAGAVFRALNHRGHSISEGWAAAPCHRHA